MKISLNWLKDYIDIEDTPEDLSEILTALGLEVEGMEEIESIPGGLKGLVIGEVLTCIKHPNADKLSLTTVDVGHESPVQIVCGAPNVAAGQKVVVATVGARLYPTAGDDFVIKKGKIRGEVSEGMICAEDEIGLGQGHDGILVLPKQVPAGTSASEHFNIETDVVYEIGLTPNRSDATSHLGVARDLAAYYSFHTGIKREVRYPDLTTFKPADSQSIEVLVNDIEACPRYSGISIDSVRIVESPQWMQNRLKAIDVRPISNIVDITNYVLHEYGQPLHAFDKAAITNNQIIVEKLPAGSSFTTLDDIERQLREEDLMICDGSHKGMCIAGVFGGAKSGVTSTTTEIFLESAHFGAQGIRKTSTKHNLRTDAAKCYEKGSDPNITIEALKRASLLMQEYAGAHISSSLIDIYPEEIQPITIEVRSSKINELIGVDMSIDAIVRVFDALGMAHSINSDGVFTVQIPTDKADVTREVDVVEEILRVYGFNNVQIDNRISTSINPSIRPDMNLLRRVVSSNLIGKGYNEMMGLSLMPSRHYEGLLQEWYDKIVYINNTSNIHLDAMRPEMMLSMMQTVQYNHNRQQKDLRLFEFGSSYETLEEDYKETEYLTIVVTGATESESWIKGQLQSDFYTIKRVVQEVLLSLGVEKYQISELDDVRFDYGLKYHKGKMLVANLGKVSSQVTQLMEIKSDVYFAEIDMAVLLQGQKNNVVVTQDIPKYPSSRRDLALVVDSTVTYDSIERIIKKAGKNLIQEISLFDVYKDPKVLGKEKKSYAISMIFSDPNKSLKDKDVDKVIQQILDKTSKELSASLR